MCTRIHVFVKFAKLRHFDHNQLRPLFLLSEFPSVTVSLVSASFGGALDGIGSGQSQVCSGMHILGVSGCIHMFLNPNVSCYSIFILKLYCFLTEVFQNYNTSLQLPKQVFPHNKALAFASEPTYPEGQQDLHGSVLAAVWEPSYCRWTPSFYLLCELRVWLPTHLSLSVFSLYLFLLSPGSPLLYLVQLNFLFMHKELK